MDLLVDPNGQECKTDTPLGKAYLFNESWTDAGGDNNFGWTGHAQFKLQTDARGLFVNGDAAIDGLVLNQTVKLVKEEVEFLSPRTGKTKGKLNLEVAGNKVLNENLEWDLIVIDSKDAEGHERYMIHKEQRLFSTTIPVGFVPVLLMVDFKTSAGPTYGLNLAPIKIWGKAEWTQSAQVIASAVISRCVSNAIGRSMASLSKNIFAGRAGTTVTEYTAVQKIKDVSACLNQFNGVSRFKKAANEALAAITLSEAA